MKFLVDIQKWIKKHTPLKHTWNTEAIFVLSILSLPAFLSHKGWIEWVGVLAVFFSFMHTSVAERLAEAEKVRNQILNSPDSPDVTCTCPPLGVNFMALCIKLRMINSIWFASTYTISFSSTLIINSIFFAMAAS